MGVDESAEAEKSQQCVDWRAAALFSDPATYFCQRSRLSHKNSDCAFTACQTMSAMA